MSNASVTNLSQLLSMLRERLAVFREFQANTDDPYYRTALSFVIEDTREAIARTASRLRQLGERTADRASTTTPQIDVSDARRQEDLAYELIYVWRALKEQLEWYNTTVKTLLDDADTQAILVALAEQNRVRLERWENLMDEMKVSPRT
jgi:hypothetical protein